jgi:hypothetical protein
LDYKTIIEKRLDDFTEYVRRFPILNDFAHELFMGLFVDPDGDVGV